MVEFELALFDVAPVVFQLVWLSRAARTCHGKNICRRAERQVWRRWNLYIKDVLVELLEHGWRLRYERSFADKRTDLEISRDGLNYSIALKVNAQAAMTAAHSQRVAEACVVKDEFLCSG